MGKNIDKTMQAYTNNILEIPDFNLPNKVVISRIYIPWKKCAMTFSKVIREALKLETLECFDIGTTHFDHMDITDMRIPETWINVFKGGEFIGSVYYAYGDDDCDNIEPYVKEIEQLILNN